MQHQQQFIVYNKLFQKQFKDKKSGYFKVPELNKMYKFILYLDFLSPFVLSNAAKVSSDELSLDFNVKYYEFLKSTPKRSVILSSALT